MMLARIKVGAMDPIMEGVCKEEGKYLMPDDRAKIQEESTRTDLGGWMRKVRQRWFPFEIGLAEQSPRQLPLHRSLYRELCV